MKRLLEKINQFLDFIDPFITLFLLCYFFYKMLIVQDETLSMIYFICGMVVGISRIKLKVKVKNKKKKFNK